MRALVYVACWAALAGCADAGEPDSGREGLRGEWVAVQVIRNGQPAPEVVGHRLTIEGGKFTVHSPERKLVYEGTVRVDAGKTPAWIDFVQTGGQARGETWKGIYALKGETLRVCDNAPDVGKARPSGFAADAGSGYVCLTFRRVGAAGDGEEADAVRAALTAMNRAFKDRDAAAIRKSMTDDHRAILPYYAEPQTPAEQVKTLSDFDITDLQMGKASVTFPADGVALVTYTVGYKGTFRGRPLLTPNLASAVWVRRGGRWLEALYQETPLRAE